MPKLWGWAINSGMRNSWSQNTVYVVAVLTFTTLLSTCVIGLVSHKLRNRNRWKVVHNTNGLRYVKTWHGWVERGQWEKRQAKKSNAWKAKTEWLGWVPTHRNLGWIFWDPTGEGRRKYDEKRATSLKRYMPNRIRRHWPGFGQVRSLSDAEKGQATSITSHHQDFGNQNWQAGLPRVSELRHTDDRVAYEELCQGSGDGAKASTGIANVDNGDRQAETIRRRNVSGKLTSPAFHCVVNVEPTQKSQVSDSPQEGVVRGPYIDSFATLPTQARARRIAKPRLWSLPLETVLRVFSSRHTSAKYDVEDNAVVGREAMINAPNDLVAPFNSENVPDLFLDNSLHDYEKVDSIDDAISLYSGSTSFSTYRNHPRLNASVNGLESSVVSRSDVHSPSASQKAQGRSSTVHMSGDRPQLAELLNGVMSSSQHSVRQDIEPRPTSAATELTGADLRISPLPKDFITPHRRRPRANCKTQPVSSPKSHGRDTYETMSPQTTGKMRQPSRTPPARPVSSIAPPVPKLKPATHPATIVPSIHLPGSAAPPSTLRHETDTKKPGRGRGVRDPATHDPPTFVDQMYRRLGWYKWNLSPGDRHDSGMGLKEVDHLDHKVYWNGRPHMDRVRVIEEGSRLGKHGGVERETRRRNLRLRRRKSMSDLQVDRVGQEYDSAQSIGEQSFAHTIGSVETASPKGRIPPRHTQPCIHSADGTSSNALTITPSNTVKQQVVTLEAATAPASSLRRSPIDIRIDTSAWMVKLPPVAGAVPLEEFRHPYAHTVAVAKGAKTANKENHGGEVSGGVGTVEIAGEEAVYTDGRGRWKRWGEWQNSDKG